MLSYKTLLLSIQLVLAVNVSNTMLQDFVMISAIVARVKIEIFTINGTIFV